MDDQQGPYPAGDVRVTLAQIAAKLDYVQASQQQMKDSLREVREEVKDVRRVLDSVPSMVDGRLTYYVRRETFEPVRLLVFGLVGLIGTAVVGALMAVVLAGRGV